MVSIDGTWADTSMDRDGVAWVPSTWDEFRKVGTGRSYLNFTGLAGEESDVGVGAAYGRNLRRLAEVKATYDPEKFFRLNNNIRPASGGGRDGAGTADSV